MARQRFRAGDPVAYRVWAYTPDAGFVQVDREAHVSAVAGDPYRVRSKSNGRRALSVVPTGHVRLVTPHDGTGKKFTLPLTEVHAR